jgi:Family of unknown function (DUF6261)
MIISINLANLRNPEFLQFSNDFLGIVQLNNPVALNVKAEFDDFTNATNTIEALFKADRGSLITDEVQALDMRRDAAITGITGYVQSLTYHFNPITRQHAVALAANLANYDASVAKQNYQAETAIIKSILTDWTEKPALKIAIEALNIANWQTELATANTTFNTTYLARTQELGAVSPDTIKEKRQEAATAYYTLRDFINSHYTLAKAAEPYKKAVNDLNALIAQYNTLLAGRKVGGGGDTTPPAV